MSLFGAYIQENTNALEVVDESYYTEYDYFTEAIEDSYKEFEAFHNFIEEKVNVGAGAVYVGAKIKKVIDKLIGMIRSLGQKIRALIGKILGNVKVAKKVSEEVKADVKEAKASKASEKAKEMIKTNVVYDMSDALVNVINKIGDPDSLDLNSNTTKNPGIGPESNNEKIGLFVQIDSEEKAIKKIEAPSLDKIPSLVDSVVAKMEANAATLKKIEGYLKKAESLANKLKARADKAEEKGVEKMSGQEQEDGQKMVDASFKLRDDVKLLTAYIAGCNKVVGYISKINVGNNTALLRYRMILKNIKKGEAEAAA